MTKPASLKKATREKIVSVLVVTFEELVGHPTGDKVKKQIKKKSRKLSRAILSLIKQDTRHVKNLSKRTKGAKKESLKAAKSKVKKQGKPRIAK